MDDGKRSPYLVGHVMDEALRLLEMKEVSYQEAWKEQGWIGNLSRVLSKTSRLRNMLYRENVHVAGFPIGDESVENQLLDLMNLAAFMLINYRNGVKWGHETPEMETQVVEPTRNWTEEPSWVPTEEPFLTKEEPQEITDGPEDLFEEEPANTSPPARKRGRK